MSVMEQTGNFWNKTNGIIGLFGIIVAIIIGCWTNKERMIELNVERSNDILLTQTFNVEGLTSKYLYRDSIPVSNLRQTTFVITNIGDEIIYGHGFAEQSIRGSSIPLRIEGEGKILSVSISKENNGGVLLGTHQLQVVQWRPNEYVEISVLSDSPKPMQLLISDREIKNSKVMYSIYTPDPVVKKERYIEYLPAKWANIFKWLYVVVAIWMWLLVASSIPQQYRKLETRLARIIFMGLISIIMIIFCLPLMWMF